MPQGSVVMVICEWPRTSVTTRTGTPRDSSSEARVCRNILRRGAEYLTDRRWHRLTALLPAADPNDEVLVVWQCYRQQRGVYRAKG